MLNSAFIGNRAAMIWSIVPRTAPRWLASDLKDLTSSGLFNVARLMVPRCMKIDEGDAQVGNNRLIVALACGGTGNVVSTLSRCAGECLRYL